MLFKVFLQYLKVFLNMNKCYYYVFTIFYQMLYIAYAAKDFEGFSETHVAKDYMYCVCLPLGLCKLYNGLQMTQNPYGSWI